MAEIIAQAIEMAEMFDDEDNDTEEQSKDDEQDQIPDQTLFASFDPLTSQPVQNPR